MRWVASGVPPSDRFVGFDCETTGLDPSEGDRIVQIGLVAVNREGIVIDTFEKMLNPQGKALSPGAAKTNGFKDIDLAREETTFADIADDITRFCDNSFIFAHKFSFDAAFISAEYERADVRPPVWDGFCTKALAVSVGLRGYDASLAALVKQFGVDHDEAHNATDDADATVRIGLGMVERMGGFHKAWRKHHSVLKSEETLRHLGGLNDTDKEIYLSAGALGAVRRTNKGIPL